MNRILLFFALLFCTLFCGTAQNLQKFSVAGFAENPLDKCAENPLYELVDGNGELFSIVKVTTNLPSDDLKAYFFDFGLCESRVKFVDGELWVYVQRNAMHVTIRRDGYVPVKNYDLRLTVQPGRVYNMQLQVAPRLIYRQMVQFNITPSCAGATVMYKKNVPDARMEQFGVTDETGSVARSLELGRYAYFVYLENYLTGEGFLNLNQRNGNHVEAVALKPDFSNITLTAGEGVDIYINDEKVGTGTWNGPLKRGTYNVECRKARHRSVSEVVSVEAGKDRTVILKSPLPITGILAVTSRPLGARITIDGKDCGVTPKNVDGLVIGEHRVEISKDNYTGVTAMVSIKENETTEYNAVLNNMAEFTIASRPGDAALYINGKHVGETPYTAEMPSGDYDIVLEKSGYHSFKKNIHLSTANPEVTFPLRRLLLRKSCGYVQAAGIVGSIMGVGANAGCYLSNFNIEAYFSYGLGKEVLYLNHDDGTAPAEEKLSPMAFGGKVGYGIIFGTRFRLTPQVGFGVLNVKGNELASSILAVSAGLRFECAVVRNFGFSLTPEYSFAVSKKDVFRQMESVSSGIKGWGNGFNASLGLYVCF